MKIHETTYKRSFEVRIPNLEGDGIATVVPIEVEVWKDEQSGDEILTPESLELIEKIKARHMGLMSPEEIFDLRDRLTLTQEEISELLQIGAKTYTRWESGRARPSRSMNVTLCAWRDGVITTEYLRALREERDWIPLLNRRVERSIILFHQISNACDSTAGRMPQTTSSRDRWLELSSRLQPELALADRSGPPLSRCRKMTISPTPQILEESAQAA